MSTYLTTAEVANLLRTSPETVRFWRHVNKGPRSFKVGRRVLYAAEDVQAYIGAARGGQGAGASSTDRLVALAEVWTGASDLSNQQKLGLIAEMRSALDDIEMEAGS